MVGEPFNQEESPYAIALSFDICKKYTNIQEVIKEQGLTYNNNNIKSIE